VSKKERSMEVPTKIPEFEPMEREPVSPIKLETEVPEFEELERR